MQASPPPRFQNDADFERLRDLFRRINYTEKGIQEAFGAHGSQPARTLTVQMQRTSRGTPRDTIIRLLLLGALVEIESLAAAIHPMTPDGWKEAGLVDIHGSTIEPLVHLAPQRGLWLAADRPKKTAGAVDVAPDYVMGVARSSGLLDTYTIRRPSRATLDVGTGCGYQALRAASHSNRILATDANPRALEYARFNSRLNGEAAVETALGDLFAPAEGQTFDLIVTNPPFVMSPRSSYIYRDSGLTGDQIIERIVRQAPAHLNDGGFCQILCNWAHLKGQDWRDRLRSWFEGSGCDAWVLRSETFDAAGYASFWINHTVGPEADRPGGLFDEWLAYYHKNGIEAVSAGLIVMRRRASGSNWVRIDDEPPHQSGDCGEHVLRGFAAWDYLSSLKEPSDMLTARFRLAPDCRATLELEPGDKGWVQEGARLRLSSGMGYEGGTDPHTMNLMVRCDGQRTLRELSDEMAATLGRDPDAVAGATIPVVTVMLRRGFLLPPARA